jgi:predicted HAD superfamily phosphohydrolase YqeG
MLVSQKSHLKNGFVKAAEMLEMDYKSIAMIGDQVLTDVVGANRVGMFSIYVKPVSKKDYWYTAWKRPLEALILKHYGYSK